MQRKQMWALALFLGVFTSVVALSFALKAAMPADESLPEAPSVTAESSLPATTAKDETPLPAGLTPQIMPHRAYYKMAMDSVRNSSEVRDAQGTMVYEWRDVCNGWATEQRLEVSFTHESDDQDVNLASAYVTWEAKDGTRYRFNYRRMANGQLIENYRGSATLSASGGEGAAHYTIPEKKDVILPAGSYFPTAHTLATLQSAIDRKPIFSAYVFDGTDAAGLSEINTVIGHRRPVVVEAAKVGSIDGAAVAWPVRMAFFPTEVKSEDGAPSEVPDYEMDSTLLPNGVSEFMLIDYGDFKLRGTLQKIELLPKPEC